MRVRILFLVLCAAFVSGCMHPKMAIPTIEAQPRINIPADAKLAPIRFDRLQFAMDRGETVGSLYGGYDGTGGLYACNVNNQGDLVWSAGKRFVGGQDDEYAEVFYDTLTGRGYNVVGDPRVIFDRSSELSKAKYLVGARLLDLKMNLCALHSILTDRATGKEVAEVYAKVEWSVYSPVEGKTVYKVVTEGYQNLRDEIAGGFTLAFLDALGVAAENLAADQGFYDLMAKNTYVDEEANRPLAEETMVLPRVDESRSPFADNPDTLLNSVVTIRLMGGGHGSGFVVSEDGYILTNDHVAGGQDRVVVRFRSGLELEGTVIRTHKVRDVALVKVPVRNMTPLPLRDKPVSVGEKVFAVGAPLDVELSHTVTGGMVSAFRHFDDWMGGLETIQADVSIYGGNSGGPLVDADGNVVGITEATRLQAEGVGTNLNYFIPIGDALKRLNLQLAN